MRRRILWGTLAVAAVILVIGAAALGLVRRQLVRQNQVELFRQAGVTAALVENRIGDLQLRQVPANARRLLEEIRLVAGHDYLEAAVVGPRVYRPLLDDAKLLPAIGAGGIDRQILEVEIDGEPVIAVVRVIDLGIVDDGANLDLLVAIGRTDPLLDPSIVTRPLLVAVLGGAFVAVLLALGLSRWFGRRMDSLSEAAGAVASGDPDARVEVDGDDEIAAVAEAFNDMTQRLAEARRREREFLMSVGHDLRTPLTTIRGYAEALHSGAISEDDVPRVADVLHRQTDRLSRLVEDLMLLARLEAREFTLRPEAVDLAAHVKGVVEAYRTRADDARIALDADIADVGLVEVDPDRVAQIAGNLIDNAFRYTPEGGRVVVALDRSRHGVVLTVRDRGPGIDPEDVPHVFERLYVAQRYRPIRPEGSGLGLSIVKELVDAMGGSIDVASAPGKGTTVTVTLPG